MPSPLRRPAALLLGAAACLAATAFLRAQSGPEKAFDSAAFVKQLQDASTRDTAVAGMATLPLEALAPLMEAAASADTPSDAAAALNAHLPEMIDRLRTARNKSDQALDEAWTQKQLIDAYKSGPAAGKVFAQAEPALRDIAANRWDYGLFKAAVNAQAAAGITPDDPAIHVAYVISGIASHEMALDHAVKQFDPALAALDASAYSDGVKFVLHRWILSSMGSPDWAYDFPIKATAKLEAARMVATLPGYVTENPGQRRLEFEVFHAFTAMEALLKDPAAFNQLSPALDQALPNSAVRDAVTAAAFEGWGWVGRGHGWGSEVTDDGWKLFRDRTTTAQQAAEAGWHKDPLNSDCLDRMITLCMDRQLGDDLTNTWFDRAMAADPDDKNACAAKALCLAPQWHKEQQDAIDFGRECITKGTPRNRISLTILDVYGELFPVSSIAAPLWQQPGVWDDILAAYAVVLSDKTRLTDDRKQYLIDRSELLNYALRCDEYQAFVDMAKEYGADVDLPTLGGKDRFAYEKTWAAKQAAH